MSEPKLTIKDPISPDTLHRLGLITTSRQQVCEQLGDLKLEEVRLTIALRQIEDEKSRVFSKELTDRGLSANAPVEVDAKTGEIKLVVPNRDEPTP